MAVRDIKLRLRVSKNENTYLVTFRSLTVRKNACVNVFGLVQKISRLDSQSKFQGPVVQNPN